MHRYTTLSASSLLLLALLVGHQQAHAASVVQNGLALFLDFDTGTGAVATDRTGNGHHGALQGPAVWDSNIYGGYLRLGATGAAVKVPSSASLRSASYTVDLWLEMRSSTLGGRVYHKAGGIGGDGLDLLEWYGRTASFRINNKSKAALMTPNPGSVTTAATGVPAPSNHLGGCTKGLRKNDGPQHYIFVHDAGQKQIRIYSGMAGQALELCYKGSYWGSVGTGNNAIYLGRNDPGGGSQKPHYYPANYYQLAFYTRALSTSEATKNHLAGPNATGGTVPSPDAGLPSADQGTPGTSCQGLPATTNAMQTVSGGPTSTARASFVIPSVPSPGGLTSATLALRLHDADHPGQEGEVFVNGKGPLQLPAAAAWDDKTVDTTMTIPVSYLVAGSNTFAFGVGSRPTTHYDVGQLALTVAGPGCAPRDAGVRTPDQHLPTHDQSVVTPDAGPRDAAAADFAPPQPSDSGALSVDTSQGPPQTPTPRRVEGGCRVGSDASLSSIPLLFLVLCALGLRSSRGHRRRPAR